MKKIIKFLLILIPISFVIGCSQEDKVEDHRKGSSASLQANVSLDKQAFKNSTLNDSIHVYSSGDYQQCVKNVVVNPAWLTPDHDVTASCSTTSDGWCWAGEASNFELKFTNSDGVDVGYVQFHEAYMTHFEVHSIKSYNGYLITVKTEVVNRASTFEIKVTVE